jgi:membrane associated rhomboid family serine protease
MLYLWIFGDNIEDRLGRGRFILYYLICGVIATFAQVLLDPGSTIPLIGASGAIAGVLGGYLMLFPRVRVTTIVLYSSLQLPAVIVLGFWFVLQLFSGAASLGVQAQMGGGVAFFAHIGGFIAGFLLVRLFGPGRV